MSRLAKILYICSGISLIGFALSRFLIGFWIPFLWIPLGLVFVFILSALFVDRALVKEFISMKTTKHGMNMGLMILLVVVGLIAVNYIGVKRYTSFDFSENQINTLSEQSIKLVKGLEEDLVIRFFYQEGVEGAEQIKYEFRNLIRKYQDESPKVQLDFVEINRRPDLAEEYDVREGGGVVFVDYMGRRNRIERIDEQELTSAILNVTREDQKKIYFTTGHGELSIDEATDPSGANALRGMLEGNRYEVRGLNLLELGQVPEDSDVLVILGPAQEFLKDEIDAISAYLKRGGSLLIALDPGVSGPITGLVNTLGVELGQNYVVNVMKTAMGDAINPNATPAIGFSPSHQITEPFPQGQFAVFRLPQSLSIPGQEPEGINFEELVSTAETSYAFDSTQFNKAVGEGPFSLAYSITGNLDQSENEFRVVVFGDSDFLNNQLLYQNLNRDLALNTMAYLSKQEDLISIAPREITRTEVNVTENQLMASVFGVFIPLPLILLITSLVLWFRRRHA